MVRRLTAIVFYDLAGFSRAMGTDEDGTLALLKRHRLEVIQPTVASHGGRIIKLMGDGGR